jgi:hypothetical protein
MEIMEITTKGCTKCNVEKSCSEFSRDRAKKDGLCFQCKECNKKYNQANADWRREYMKKWHQENAEKIKKYRQENAESLSEKKKKYQQENADRIKGYRKKYEKNRRNSDPLFRMILNLRRRVSSYCRAIKVKKSTRTKEMLGLNLAGFKSYMESKFQDGMTWENYGQWHVDHIKPLSLATTEQEIIELNHYTNLQPLWASENLKKSNRYEEAQHGNYGESFV